MTTACSRPSSNNDIRLAAYDTESVDPLTNEIGRLTFHVDVSDAQIRRTTNISGCGYVRGKNATSAIEPTAMTAATYKRTAGGSAPDDDAAAVPLPCCAPRRVIPPIRSNMPDETRASISLLVILLPHHLAREIGAARAPDNRVGIHGRPDDGFVLVSGPHDRLFFPGRP